MAGPYSRKPQQSMKIGTSGNCHLYANRFSDKLEHLAQTGVTGSPGGWVGVGLRAFPYKGRCFYFRIIGDQMIVIRVLHGRQDVSGQSFYDEF